MIESRPQARKRFMDNDILTYDPLHDPALDANDECCQ